MCTRSWPSESEFSHNKQPSDTALLTTVQQCQVISGFILLFLLTSHFTCVLLPSAMIYQFEAKPAQVVIVKQPVFFHTYIAIPQFAGFVIEQSPNHKRVHTFADEYIYSLAVLSRVQITVCRSMQLLCLPHCHEDGVTLLCWIELKRIREKKRARERGRAK